MKRSLHEIAKRLFSVFHLRIRSGPLAGSKWIVSTGKNFITGEYEPEKTRCIAQQAKPGMVAVDIGAHVGYYTLILAQCVGPTGEVHSFEPRKLNLDFLRKHLRLNQVGTVRTYAECVGDQCGEVGFEERTGTGTGHVSESGPVRVAMTTIDHCVESGRIPRPDFIKIDVEGAEMRVLNGARKAITAAMPVLILAVHSDAIERECREFLEPLGYAFQDLGQTSGDREFLVTPA